MPGLPDRLQLLPMRRREPFKIARGEIQRGRARVAEVEALIADYEGGAAL